MACIGALCERLYGARAAAGLTQQDVASRAGVTRQTVAKIEGGKLDSATFGSFLKIASVLDLEVELADRHVPAGKQASRLQ